MRKTILAVVFTLSACGQPNNAVTKADIQEINDRLDKLEKTVAAQTKPEKLPLQPPPMAKIEPPKPRMTYQLVGTSFRAEQAFRYRSEEACERARQALLESWREADENSKAQRVLFTSRPTPTCLPL